MILNTLRFLIISFIASFVFISCEPKDGIGIPSYIHISQIDLSTNSAQGTASHKITDAWVYIEGQLIGVFELPATFPLLKSGSHEVTIYAGIKVNGISATRSPYPFYNPVNLSANLIPGAVDTLPPITVTYDPTTTFVWMENFDTGAMTLDTTTGSQAPLVRTSDPTLVFAYNNETNTHSATAFITGDSVLFECVTVSKFNLPKNGSPVFLEMNYKNNFNLTVGLIATVSGQTYQQPVLVLNPSPDWNKIYINLTPTIAYYATATDFRIFLGLLRTPGADTASISLDHLKLLH